VAGVGELADEITAADEPVVPVAGSIMQFAPDRIDLTTAEI
jgi:hypothetical protein